MIPAPAQHMAVSAPKPPQDSAPQPHTLPLVCPCCYRINYLPFAKGPAVDEALALAHRLRHDHSAAALQRITFAVGVTNRGVHFHGYSGAFLDRWVMPGWVPPMFSPVASGNLNAEAMMALQQITDVPRRKLATYFERRRQNLYRVHVSPHRTVNLRTLAKRPLPSGAGDCAGAKVLNEMRRTNQVLEDLAEFAITPAGLTWSAPCAHRCQPWIGALLCACEGTPLACGQLEVLYESSSCVVVDKPSGLLSAPGPGGCADACVTEKVRAMVPQAQGSLIVHRLDMDTSGVLIVALNNDAVRALNAQFARRQVHKLYTAQLESPPAQDQGDIVLPLGPDPTFAPRQRVDHHAGKRSHTRYWNHGQGRVTLQPITGRSHQLRVHAAHPEGLNSPIVGDPLYGKVFPPEGRLQLHATEIRFVDPHTQRPILVKSRVPF